MLQGCIAAVRAFYTQRFNSALPFSDTDILIRTSLVMFQRTAALPCLKPTDSLLFYSSGCSKTAAASSPHTHTHRVIKHALRSPFMCSDQPTCPEQHNTDVG